MCDCNKKDEFLIQIVEEYGTDKSNLIQILNGVQEHYGYVSKEGIIYISEKLNIPASEIYGVVTFYSRFSLKPKGKYNICVCQGTACYVKGGERILEKVKSELGIEVGETTADGKFSLEPTRCLGACGLAPVFTINNKVYGNVTVDLVQKVLKEYKEKDNNFI